MQTMPPLFVNFAPALFKIDPPGWAELGVYFVGLLSLFGVIYTASVTRKTGKEANAVNQLPLLWDRIDKLSAREQEREKLDDAKDKRMDELEKSQRSTDQRLTETLEVLSIALEFIGTLFHWGRQGGGEPEPTVPAKLADWLKHVIHRDEER